MKRQLALLGTTLILSGCFVVTPDHRDDVLGGQPTDGGGMDGSTDGGDSAVVVTPDAGDNLLVDTCGDETATYEVLRDSRPPFLVDTTAMVNRVSSCGAASAPGNDGFLAVEVTAGDQWHFHVIPDPATAGQVRDPFLYLVLPSGASCDTRACQFFSNSCTGTGDEHFAFIAPEDGIWYLGIDDAMAGGGVYQIEAVRLECGNGDKVHGEACDGSGTCNSSCQEILSETRPNEIEANDNPIEANFVEIPAANTVTIAGTIGGDSCTYPDVYNFRVATEGSSLAIDMLNSDGTPCATSALTADYDVVLRNSAGEVRAGPSTNPANGCAELRVTGLSAAAYFLSIEHDEPIRDRVVTYRTRITVIPP